ncbi:hypothetical protein K469DRAFT_398977 [Zopfia rhizophila CBS 207.26]|uniref:Uncharacterized protein n=1 Tax=Zopfia rhizophila CBS 207.26 TaxID=1314779 RepID=A0A6A6DGJ2_9PEZI|nr:hypothetical protein K469DRAFT_398977 [Zopfia rhizophila CBS 207.26]
MGNAQSAGHHNRLSKPKTNTNSPFTTPKIDSPSSVTSRYADLSIKDRLQLKEQLTSPIETDFGSGFSSDEDYAIGELATHVQVRLSNLSRSNSVASHIANAPTSSAKLASLPGSKLSLVSNAQHVDLDTAIKILQEVRKNATPEDLAALHQALLPSAPSSSPASNQGLNRKTSVINRSSSSLIRRRSLAATPGLATRCSPTQPSRKSSIRWGTLQAEPREQKWRVEMMGSSPLTRLAALDLADDGRESPTPRAKTPGDMDYSHLGSLKLGSLVVTNGAPSPAPSAVSRKVTQPVSNPDASQEEDYFTASEGCSSPVKWMPPLKGRRHARSKSSVLPLSSPPRRELRLSDRTPKAKTTSGCDSPLKTEMRTPYYYDSSEREPMKLRLRVVNKSADTLARDYAAELPASPFVNRKDSCVEHHDEGFRESFSDDALSFREEAFRILDGTIFSDLSSDSDPAKPAVQPTCRDDSTRGKNRRPTPKKADSGYSSGGSFRVSQRAEKAMAEGTFPTISQKASIMADFQKHGNDSDSDDEKSLYTFEQMLSLPISQKPLPALPIDETLEKKPTLLQLSEPASSYIHSSPSPVTPKSVSSHFTVDSKASTQKRLRKRRPSSQNLPVVQSCQPIAEGSIPNVPVHIRDKFTRRLSESPAMECLTQTYTSSARTNCNESVTDSPAIVPIQFPSPSATPLSRPRRETRSQTERPPTPPHGIRRSLSLFRNRPAAAEKKQGSGQQDDHATSVVDLGTVASTLGRSPYDVAMPVVLAKTVTSPTHPHQLGNALPRAKSMVNMDARTAAKLARIRSKDCALLGPEMSRRPKSYHDLNLEMGEASTPRRRPRSYHDLNLEAGEAIASKRRPHRIYTDIPPVPTIEPNRLSLVRSSTPRADEDLTTTQTKAGPNFRARSTGRGPVVSQLVDKYDKYGQKRLEPKQQNWESHARLWSQRRISIGEGLRQHAEVPQASSSMRDQRASSQPPEDIVYGRYSGGLDYGYEHGFGIGGSAGMRQLHSAASRKSMHFSNQFGVDLSDVPVFVQRR